MMAVPATIALSLSIPPLACQRKSLSHLFFAFLMCESDLVLLFFHRIAALKTRPVGIL